MANMRQEKTIHIIGGGFAGTEAAWAAASRGTRVVLHEMRPTKTTAVHRTGDLAELVCSNSLKSNLLTNASGVLKEEMVRLGSLTIPAAYRHRVPAGDALAVDRIPFSKDVTTAIESNPNITVIREEITQLPPERPLVVATGPLTSDALARSLENLTGKQSLYFYDAVAPTVTLESLNMDRIFRGSRRGRSDQYPGSRYSSDNEGDYLNCPFERDEYEAFWNELVKADAVADHNPEDQQRTYFEMCMPVEEIARRGMKTLTFGCLKPIGLRDPRATRRPYAVAQLRQDNMDGTIWGLVGFQTRLKWGEQKRIFRMVPGLENAEFVRYGVMHRNTYVNSPSVLNTDLSFKSDSSLFLAGQLTGVEGYLESAAIGLLAGINAHRLVSGRPIPIPPRETVMGSLVHYLVETEPSRFSPMNAHFGIMPPLDGPIIRDKREKAMRKAARALEAIDRYIASLNEL